MASQGDQSIIKIQRRDGKRERTILIGMVTNDVMIARISPRWEGEMFASSWSNALGQWCVDHHRKYKKAIGKGIENEFAEWADGKDEDVVKAMSNFLESLSVEYEAAKDYNIERSYDTAIKHFNRVRTEKLKNQLEIDLANNDDDRALARIADFAKLEASRSTGTKFLTDKAEVMSTFDSPDRGELMVKYAGALGEFFQNCMERGSLVAFCAPTKTGKTWWLIDVAYRALLGRRRVAFFEIGDQTHQQIKERFLVRIAGHPSRSDDGKWPVAVTKPISLETLPVERYGIKPMTVQTRNLIFNSAINGQVAWKAVKRFRKLRIRTNRDLFWLDTFPSKSISVDGIEEQLEMLESSGWGTPDVVVIDYADNLKPLDKKAEYRNQIHETWKRLNELRQKYNCCLVTASQVKIEGYTAKWLNLEHFADDSRKAQEVTAMIGINQNDNEKEQGSYRLNYMAKREGKWNNKTGVYVAGCLAIGNPAVKSSW